MIEFSKHLGTPHHSWEDHVKSGGQSQLTNWNDRVEKRLWSTCTKTFPQQTRHGTTLGKRYRFRGDCPECLGEAAERQAQGVQVRSLIGGFLCDIGGSMKVFYAGDYV